MVRLLKMASRQQVVPDVSKNIYGYFFDRYKRSLAILDGSSWNVMVFMVMADVVMAYRRLVPEHHDVGPHHEVL